MSSPADYRREITKTHRGPAFPHCLCCRMGKSLGDNLTRNNRIIRRRRKQELRDVERV